MFYRDRPVRGVAWAWLCGAVSIEPFEVSLWRGGLLWDFNKAGSLVQSRRGRLRAGAATLDVEEAECGHSLRHRLRSQLALAKQVELVLTDMFRAKLVGSTMKVFSKLLDPRTNRLSRYLGHSCDARVLRASGL